jgi:hypothetical protein
MLRTTLAVVRIGKHRQSHFRGFVQAHSLSLPSLLADSGENAGAAGESKRRACCYVDNVGGDFFFP